uniref:Uncharacterized protein n=1 Tax=Arundo donax TaxID=35708 RepID=A0A0A9C182_ARUDO
MIFWSTHRSCSSVILWPSFLLTLNPFNSLRRVKLPM